MYQYGDGLNVLVLSFFSGNKLLVFFTLTDLLNILAENKHQILK